MLLTPDACYLTVLLFLDLLFNGNAAKLYIKYVNSLRGFKIYTLDRYLGLVMKPESLTSSAIYCLRPAPGISSG
jgi:hypothetical protein